MIAILLPDEADALCADRLAELAQAFGPRAYCGLSFRRRPDEHVRLHDLADLADLAVRTGVRAVALGDVLYHGPEARLLQDVVTAIRERTTIDALGFRRERHADRALSRRPTRWRAGSLPFPARSRRPWRSRRPARSISASWPINIRTRGYWTA